MPQRSPTLFDPRKTPVQARSTASVDAILDATLQVLLSVGKERLTTTKVAFRAGVSVGTLYQYFPNKSALLQAVIKRHLDEVTLAVEDVCRQQRSNALRQMATALIDAFLAAKMRSAKTSAALYAISADVDGARIVREMADRIVQAIAEMLSSAREPLAGSPQVTASMLQGVLAGVSRGILESGEPEQQLAAMRQELVFLACSYLTASSSAVPPLPQTIEPN